MKKTLDLSVVLTPHNLATEIANKWNEWDSYREKWKKEKSELRNYIYATDTSTTSNSRLPWSNSTTTPKLCQIYDNLKANYTAALFPNSRWMKWIGDDSASMVKEKVATVQAYMENKLEQSKFELEIDKIVDDYILYGNCFGTVKHETEVVETEDGPTLVYSGPRLQRISPYDIVFNPTASTFENTPKIIRSLVTLGEAKKMLDPGVFEDMLRVRREVGSATSVQKSDAYVADGFGSIEHYYGSGYVEFLTFYGDIYDVYGDEYHENREITVVDRVHLVSNEAINNWFGKPAIFHAGWRLRPDNLWAMGPLDNLVGMQYRIDHLENLKADVFDQIALPMIKIKGDVEDFDFQPGERIFMGEEGDVGYLVPDASALQADFQIQALENKMEELAGAPRQAMGIRTPGEKTAFEVQTLQNSSSRIFQHKTKQFEIQFVEPVLNAMLETGRRHLNTSEVIKVFDDEAGVFLFTNITQEDIQAKGRIKPMGARHFAERAQRVQNITNLQMAKQDPAVAAHLSGKVMARILSEEIGEEELFGENIAVDEQLETQQRMQDAEAQNVENLTIQEQEGI